MASAVEVYTTPSLPFHTSIIEYKGLVSVARVTSPSEQWGKSIEETWDLARGDALKKGANAIVGAQMYSLSEAESTKHPPRLKHHAYGTAIKYTK